MFGEGTYLSGELSVSMIYSPSGQAWDHSDIGNKLSCVAVCEMIDDPSVKCQNKGKFYHTGTSFAFQDTETSQEKLSIAHYRHPGVYQTTQKHVHFC